MNSTIPIIRLEVEGMRHSVLAALTEHQVVLDESIQKAVTDFLKPQNEEVEQ